MKEGNWIPVDKRLIYLLPHNREYTYLEAYICFRNDLDDCNNYTISGYSKMWRWSRNKVRNFIEGLRTGKGHSVDTQRTGKGQEIRIINKELEGRKDRRRTGKGQAKDTQEDTTIKTKNIYAENVQMTSAEYASLIEKYGTEQTEWMVLKLNAYKGSSGKKYKSDYLAMLNWVVDKAGREFKPQKPVLDQMGGY